MSSIILFVFEGEKIEPQILKSFEEQFSTKDRSLKCVYGTVIYNLYSKIAVDDSFDTLILLKEYAKITKELVDYEVDDISEIYFFFDYDGHASSASDIKLENLLNLFDDPLGVGKLYISYPMAESLKHFSDKIQFQDLKFDISKGRDYKGVVKQECSKEFEDIISYTTAIWNMLIDVHLKKMNYIVNGTYVFPSEEDKVKPKEVFSKQLEKYINIDNSVAVVSAFPMFLFDYYKYDKFMEMIK
jgi:hypothetical protein